MFHSLILDSLKMGSSSLRIFIVDDVKMEVTVGQKVIYSKYAGTNVKMEEEEYIIVKQSDILAIVE